MSVESFSLTEEESRGEGEDMYWQVMMERYCHGCVDYDPTMDECEDDPTMEDIPSCYRPSSKVTEA